MRILSITASLTLAPLLLALFAGCSTRGATFDPTVLVLGSEGEELGVSTPYGVVFLGHNVTDDVVRLVPAFGDGPSVERAPAEAVDRGLRLARAEIQLPTVPISFDTPAPGSRVLVRGRDGLNPWSEEVKVANVPSATGLVLEADASLRRRLEAGVVGAGVYVFDEHHEMQLVGLVDGLFSLNDTTYIATAGPGSLWRAAAHDRSLSRQRWVYREDV